eukprot:2507378-Alexandrium_andersonii.AAC.1
MERPGQAWLQTPSAGCSSRHQALPALPGAPHLANHTGCRRAPSHPCQLLRLARRVHRARRLAWVVALPVGW